MIVLLAAQTDLEKENDLGQAPVHITAILGNAMLVELLLFLGVNPSLRDCYRVVVLFCITQHITERLKLPLFYLKMGLILPSKIPSTKIF